MGNYLYFCGEMKVPEERLPELTERMMNLFEQGGMMKAEEISLFGMEVVLLCPVEPDEDQRVLLSYNYFDDDGWETAAYDLKTGKLGSGRIGWHIFADVVLAAYILLEFYTEKYTVTMLEDSYILGAWKTIQWLNYLFDEKYCDTRQIDPQRMLELLKKAEAEKNESMIECLTEVSRIGRPLGKISTREYLGRFSKLTDDDLAYFWRPDGDIVFSDEMSEWLNRMGTELDEIESEETELLQEMGFSKALVETLDDANRTFGRLYFFRDAFYDLLERSGERRVQATVVLLRRLIERNRETFCQIEKDPTIMWGMRCNGENHPARLEVKRFFAVLGNPFLREKWLKFQ